MKLSTPLMIALLALGTQAMADNVPLSPGVVQPTSTPVPKPLSTPDVVRDPRFTLAEYAWKWPHISLEEAERLHKRKDVLFVDGRAMVEWEASHIPGAIALPIGEFDKNYAAHKKQIRAAKIIVSYCHGEGCRLSDMLAQKLVDKGHKNVAVFWGGFPAWDGAQLPLMDKNNKPIVRPTPVPPQPSVTGPVSPH